MNRTVSSTPGPDGPSPQPSTRRVSSGSPTGSPRPGEPIFSNDDQAPPSRTDKIFEDLKARIGRLWDADGDADEIRETLIDGK